MSTWSVDGRYLFEGCCTCKVSFAITRETYEVLKQTCQTFYCPHGHRQSYVRGKSEEEKLREERDRLAQRIAEKDGLLNAGHAPGCELAAMIRLEDESAPPTTASAETARR